MYTVILLDDAEVQKNNNGKCQYPGCDEPATDIAEDRDRRTVEFYCDKHADRAVDQGSPEYRVCCPNCGCGFGVN